jgi:hypothetical protein
VNKLLLRILVGVGFVGVITGALAYALMLGLLYLTNFPPDLTRELASAVGIAGAFVGLYLDSNYEISAQIYRKIWLDEQESTRKLLEDGSIDYRQALEKYYNASFELSQVPNFFRRLLPTLSKNVSKEAHKDKLWVVQYVLPRLPSEALPEKQEDLSQWLPVVDELVSCLLVVRGAHGFFSRWVSDPLNPDQVAQEVIQEWQRRHIADASPTESGHQHPSEPRQLSGSTPISGDVFKDRTMNPEKVKRSK